jgi:hypothetical protein
MQAAGAPADVVQLAYRKEDPNAYAASNVTVLDEAAREASAVVVRTFAMVVWDGVDRGADDVTKAFLEEARQRKLETISVPTL